MRARSCGSAPMPSGKSAATSTKKAITSSVSPGWRQREREVARERPGEAARGPVTASRGARDAQRRASRAGAGAGRGGSRRVPARRARGGARAVRAKSASPVVVERGERLVEHPDRRRIEQRGARARCGGAVPPRGGAPEARGACRGPTLARASSIAPSLGCRAAKRERAAQVLLGGEVVLDAREVAGIERRARSRAHLGPQSRRRVRPATQRSSVVLPLPLAPRTASHSPRSMRKETSRKSVTGPREHARARASRALTAAPCR